MNYKIDTMRDSENNEWIILKCNNDECQQEFAVKIMPENMPCNCPFCDAKFSGLCLNRLINKGVKIPSWLNTWRPSECSND